MRPRRTVLLFGLATVLSTGCQRGVTPPEGAAAKILLRVGHFPNVTHAQALAAHALSRRGEGWFEYRLDRDVEIQWFVYNAGPTAMEANFAGSLVLTYVGPSPALNAYVKSGGEEVRIIAVPTCVEAEDDEAGRRPECGDPLRNRSILWYTGSHRRS